LRLNCQAHTLSKGLGLRMHAQPAIEVGKARSERERALRQAQVRVCDATGIDRHVPIAQISVFSR
jgi:hypothetical protein